ncbi:MAG: aminotransferase class I/II-fold pyridoxal phosphate-dependent enzyme [Candidatus Puniceispirillaceae bacterium]
MFNSAVATLNAPPVSVVLNWKSSYDGANGPLIDMSQAVPGYASHPDILAALAAAAADPALARYGPVEGDPDFRRAYADHVSHIYNAPIDQSEVQVTSGCNQAFVATVLAIAGHGDRVLMMRPCYFNHESTLGMLGVGIDYVDCDADAGLLPDCAAIDAAIGDKTRAVALVSPNNPAGRIYPAPLRAEILALCRRRGIWLILVAS